MARLLLMGGAILGLLGVAAGAFGAHGLRKYFADNPDLGTIFETACRYQLIHAVALLGVALAWQQWPSRALAWAGILMFAGVVVFSGSLFALALSGVRSLGAITPLGGLALLAGWTLVIVAAFRMGAE